MNQRQKVGRPRVRSSPVVCEGEETLRENERFLQSIFDCILDGIIVLDKDLNIVRVNRLMERWFRHRTPLVGRKCYEALHNRTDLCEICPSMQAMASKKPEVTIHRCAAGSPLGWMEVFSFPLFDDEGNVTGVIEDVRDVTDRMQAEEALRHGEEKYRKLVEDISDWVWEVDENNTYTYVSPRVASLLGYEPKEVLGKTPFDFMLPEEAERVRNLFAPLAELREPLRSLENILVHMDGHLVIVETSGSPIFDDQGRFRGYRGIDRDITERKHVEEARTRLAAIVEGTTDFASLADTEGHVIYINSAGRRMVGIGVDEDVSDLEIPGVHPEWATNIIFNEGIPTAARNGSWSGETALLSRDGREIPVSQVIIAHTGADGNAEFFATIMRDITERKHAEEERDMSLARLQALWNITQMKEIEESELYQLVLTESVRLTGSKYGLIARIPEGGKTFELQSWTPEVGRDCRVPGERHVLETDRLTLLGRVVHEKAYVIDNKCKARIPIGHVTIERILAVPILRDGDVCEVIAVANKFTDYNEQDANQLLLLGAGAMSIVERSWFEEEVKELTKNLERRVAERTAQLEDANKELVAFTYSASHDLRAPLRSIDGFSLAILEDYWDKLDPVGRDYLNRVRASTQRMGHLIDDLLRLSKVTRVEMRCVTVNLSKIARDTLARLQASDKERKLEIVIQPDVTVEGDPDLLRLALGNLLDNAWKFTSNRPVGKIEFGTTRIDDKLAYFVRDNGVGFDMARANKLFKPFQRLHTDDEFPGTGIGLAIVRRVISRHEGRLWAEGKVNKGATFYFTLQS